MGPLDDLGKFLDIPRSHTSCPPNHLWKKEQSMIFLLPIMHEFVYTAECDIYGFRQVKAMHESDFAHTKDN